MKKHDLVGKKVGFIEVIKELPEITYKQGRRNLTTQNWLVKCICGKEYERISKYLVYGTAKSCGCQSNKIHNLVGKRFGYGVVMKFLGRTYRSTNNKNTSVRNYELICDCGNTYQCTAEYLQNGHKKSCGCAKKSFHNTPKLPSNYTATTHIYQMVKQLKSNAKKHSLEFSINQDIILEKLKSQNGKCAISGIDIDFFTNNASVDRIDSIKGYTPDNIQIVYRTINFMKSTIHMDDFVELCHKISKYQTNIRPLLVL